MHLDSVASSLLAFCLRNCLLSKKRMLIAVAAVAAGSSSVTWAEETQSPVVKPDEVLREVVIVLRLPAKVSHPVSKVLDICLIESFTFHGMLLL